MQIIIVDDDRLVALSLKTILEMELMPLHSTENTAPTFCSWIYR